MTTLVLRGLLQVGHGRQLGRLDDDRLGGVLGLLARLGHDDGDRVAVEPDLVARERPVRSGP